MSKPGISLFFSI